MRGCKNLIHLFSLISVEHKLLDREWGSKPPSCDACQNDKYFGCATPICVVSSLTKIPKQYNNVCEFYKDLHHHTYSKTKGMQHAL